MPHTFDSVAFIDASLGLHKAAYSSEVICLSGAVGCRCCYRIICCCICFDFLDLASLVLRPAYHETFNCTFQIFIAVRKSKQKDRALFSLI
jgi:hypothetical protein